MKTIKNEDQIFKILKDFTLDCVHGGDFDQGNSQEDTLNVLKTWWNKKKNNLDFDKSELDLSEIIPILHKIGECIDVAVENGAEENKISEIIELMKGIADDNWVFIRN